MLLSFFQTEAGLAALFSVFGTVIAALVTQWLRGKVNLIWFSPNSTYFILENKENGAPIHVNSGQIVVQNLGRQSARQVQITSVPGGAPAGYVMLPNIVHSTCVGPNNQWIIEIPFVAPREVITVQILNGPKIDSVRSEDGVGKFVPVIHQRLFPKIIQLLIEFLVIVGVISIFYLIGWILIHS